MLTITLATLLTNRGHSVDIITDTASPLPVDGCSVYGPHLTEHEPYLSGTGNAVDRLVRRVSEYIWLKNHIRQKKYDIVYGVSAQAFTLSAVHIARMSGIPTAFETSLLGNDDYLTVCNSRTGFILKRFFLSADRIVNISPPLEEVCLAGGIDHDRLAMIPNPANEKAFRLTSDDERTSLRNSLGLPHDSTVLFSAGAVSYRKGYDRLISVFIELASELPEMTLVLAGPVADDADSKHLFMTLKSDLADAGCENRVKWLGRVENVADWMRASDIFIFASRREGFGTVFTEAMAVGLPIVTYRIPGITDYIFGNHTATSVVDTEDDFSNATRELCRNVKLRNERGALMRERYDAAFSSNKIADMYDSLFSTITS